MANRSPQRSPSAEIDEGTKARIRTEEEIRATIRRELESPRTQNQNAVMAFLNSNFALWFLSAVVIGGLGSWYSRCEGRRDQERIRLEHQLDQEKEARETIARLDTEISYRLSQALLTLKDVDDQQVYQLSLVAGVSGIAGASARTNLRLQAARDSSNVFQTLLGSSKVGFPTLYTEHATRNNVLTLISELKRYVTGKELEQLATASARLAVLTHGRAFATEWPAREAAKQILETIILDRWARSAFSFVRCKPANPFC